MGLTKRDMSTQLEVIKSVCDDPDSDSVGDQIVKILEDGECSEGIMGDARDRVFYALGYLESAARSLDMNYVEIVDEYL